MPPDGAPLCAVTSSLLAPSTKTLFPNKGTLPGAGGQNFNTWIWGCTVHPTTNGMVIAAFKRNPVLSPRSSNSKKFLQCRQIVTVCFPNSISQSTLTEQSDLLTKLIKIICASEKSAVVTEVPGDRAHPSTRYQRHRLRHRFVLPSKRVSQALPASLLGEVAFVYIESKHKVKEGPGRPPGPCARDDVWPWCRGPGAAAASRPEARLSRANWVSDLVKSWKHCFIGEMLGPGHTCLFAHPADGSRFSLRKRSRRTAVEDTEAVSLDAFT